MCVHVCVCVCVTEVGAGLDCDTQPSYTTIFFALCLCMTTSWCNREAAAELTGRNWEQ